MVRVLYFAACREPAGVDAEDLDVRGTVTDVTRAVRARHPALADILARCRVAVNQSFAQPNDLVPDGAEVAFIPPVAGG